MSLLDRFNELAQEQKQQAPDTFIVDSWLRVPLTHPDVEDFKEQFMVRNAEYMSALKGGMSTKGLRQWDPLWQEDKRHGHLLLPRGVATRYLGTPNFTLDDRTTKGDREVDFKSRINARPNQESFITALYGAVTSTYGALGMAEPGFGKQ